MTSPTPLFPLWSTPAAGEDGVALSFQPAGPDADERRRVLVVDDLVGWDVRERVDSDVEAALCALRDGEVGELRVDGVRLEAVARYRLRFELTHALVAFEAARAADAAAGPFALGDAHAPAAVMLGAGAALGAPLPVAVPGHWTALYTPPSFEGPRAVAGALMQHGAAAVTRAARVRVAAVPGLKVAPALAAVPRRRLAAAGVAVTPFPELSLGEAPLLAWRRRVAAIRPGRRDGRGDGPGRADLPRLARDEALDAALRLLVEHVLDDAARDASRIAAALEPLERLERIRALLLPTSALGAARAAFEWARARGLTCATLQHGFYVMRGLEDADQGADVLFTWGGEVGGQVASWPSPPTPVAVGLPGAVRAGRSEPARVRRVLLATSAGVAASALFPYGYSRALVEAVGPALRTLAGAGAEVAVRAHPGERPSPYPRLLSELGVAATVDEERPLEAALAHADLVVTSTSSVAFEAALAGIPVAVWYGPMPAALRRERFLPPFDGATPGMFEGPDELTAFAERALADPRAGLGELLELGEALLGYVEPFSPDRFADGLEALAR